MEKNKATHDKIISRKNFEDGQKVLLFESHLKLFLGKPYSLWIFPFIIKNVYSCVLEIRSEKT